MSQIQNFRDAENLPGDAGSSTRTPDSDKKGLFFSWRYGSWRSDIFSGDLLGDAAFP